MLVEENDKIVPKGKDSAQGRKSAEKVRVTVDMDEESVIELSERNVEISFADSKGEFLQLSSEAIKKLRMADREKYFLAFGRYQFAVEEALDEATEIEGLKISGRLASATSRLEVSGKDPKLHYCWKRPDELRQAGYEGYQVAKGSQLRSFGGGPGTVHRVGALGEDELVLMQKPKEQAQKDLLAPAQKSKNRVRQFDKAAKESIGRHAFDDSGAKAGSPFTPTRKGE